MASDEVKTIELKVLNSEGVAVGTLPVGSDALGGSLRPALLHRALVRYGANKRQGTASSKTRGEIWKSNRKPWPQKGTGRARAGTRRSPLWRGGGIIFGPKPRDYSSAMNVKQRRLALRAALLWKMLDGQVTVVEGLDIPAPKTKLLAQQLRRLGIEGSCLVGLPEVPRHVVLAARNLPGVKVVPVREFNAYDVVRRGRVLLTRDAVELLVRRPGAGPAPGGAKEDA